MSNLAEKIIPISMEESIRENMQAVIASAKAIVIQDEVSYQSAAATLKLISERKKQVQEYWKKPKEAASKAHKEICANAYNEAGFKVILDDKVLDRTQDRLRYDFKKSLQYKEWSKILESGVAFDQKNLLDFLRRREIGEIDAADAITAAIQNFKYVTNIAGDFTYDDNNNYTFGIKIGDAEGTVKLPQYLYADIEVYNESGFIQSMEIELEVRRPKAEGEKPMFVLTCPKLARYLKEALDNEISTVKGALEGYLIVAGNI